MRGLAVLSIVLASAGCLTAARWERPGMTDAERRRDEAECAALADRERAVPARRIVSSSRRGVDETVELVPRREFDFAAFDECMAGRGYRRVRAAGA